jgi:hypothetical protein
LCDAGRIEDYDGAFFAPIAQDLVGRTPEAQLSTFMQAHSG